MLKNGCRQNKVLNNLLSILLVFILPIITAFFPFEMAHAATFERAVNLSVSVDGGEAVTVKGFNMSADNNLFFSLRDMAAALSSTPKRFDISIDNSQVDIVTDVSYTGDAGEAFSDNELEKIFQYSARLDNITLNEDDVRYYHFTGKPHGGYEDSYMRLSDIAMMLNFEASFDGDVWHIDTKEDFGVNIEQLEERGYFKGVNSAVVGDASTGEIYYSYNENTPVAIASITKLMTYMVFMDGVYGGEVSLSDEVMISARVHDLSVGEDGVIPMSTGQYVPVEELLVAMLLPSSNESALALAEHLAGSEEEFVGRMQEKAAEIGIYSAEFYNCSGLPVYTEGVVTTKVQNTMTAKDMFKLASYLLENYPEVTNITDTTEHELEVLDMEIKNSNTVVYNIPEVTGLKTGTTNRSGSSLVVSGRIGNGRNAHDIVALVFGAESAAYRTQYGEILMRYAMNEYEGRMNGTAGQNSNNSENPADKKDIPRTADRFIWTVMSTARNRGIIN